MARSTRTAAQLILLLTILLLPTWSQAADDWNTISARLRRASQDIDVVSTERYAALREAERYQYEVALRYYKAGDWKVAMAECEKYLRLYERSELAPLVQLWWSHCLFHQQKANTAIRDGYQSVVDYWPDSPEAANARYYIARTYRDIGEVRRAEDGYRSLIRDAGDSFVAVVARSDLKDMARVANDEERWLAMLKELAFTVKPTEASGGYVRQAAYELAQYYFGRGEFDPGREAVVRWLDVYGRPQELAYRIQELARSPISSLTSREETKAKGERMADAVISLIEKERPAISDETKEKAQNMTFWIADLHGSARRPEKQYETYEKMLETFGVNDAILGQMASWHRAREKYDEARAIYNRFADEIEGQRQIAYCFRLETKFDQAIAIYTELVTRDADRASSYQYAVGDCYRDSGRHVEAIGAYRVIDEFPEPQWRMAHCRQQLKQYEEARVLYGQIMTGTQDDNTASRALYEIAQTYESETKPEQAITTFQRVCKLFPKTSYASNAHTRLQDKYGISITLGGVTEKD
jgi:TolA-binding protein